MLKRTAAVVFIHMVIVCTAFAEGQRRLFTIERNLNSNVVVYEANINAHGEINPDRPVNAFWMLYEDHCRREKLNLLEWSMAYGFDIVPVKAGSHYRMSVKSCKNRIINILLEHNLPRAIIEINGRKGYLSKIYVHTIKGMIAMHVRHIELFGSDVVSGKKLYEKIVNRDL